MNKKFRKRLFVDHTVQGAIVRRLVLHWLVVFAVLTAFLVVMQVLTSGPFKPLSQHLSDIWNQYGLLLASLVCLLPVFAYDSVKLSHRFAGPMINFRNALKKLADGEDIATVKFRKNDYWQPLTEDLNRIASELKVLRKTEGNVDASDEQPSEDSVSV